MPASSDLRGCWFMVTSWSSVTADCVRQHKRLEVADDRPFTHLPHLRLINMISLVGEERGAPRNARSQSRQHARGGAICRDVPHAPMGHKFEGTGDQCYRPRHCSRRLDGVGVFERAARRRFLVSGRCYSSEPALEHLHGAEDCLSSRLERPCCGSHASWCRHRRVVEPGEPLRHNRALVGLGSARGWRR